jgi:hypothetical protein
VAPVIRPERAERAEEGLLRHKEVDDEAAVRAVELRGEHRDDAQNRPADGERASDNIRFAAEHRLPVAVRDHERLVLPVTVVEDIAERRFYPE